MKKQKGFTVIEFMIIIAIVAIMAAVLIPKFLRNRDQAELKLKYDSREVISNYINEAIIGNNTAYIPLEIEIDCYNKEIKKLAIAIIDKFQEKHGVQILSWNFDKEYSGSSLQAKISGITITFFKPEDKLSETQNSNENSSENPEKEVMR